MPLRVTRAVPSRISVVFVMIVAISLVIPPGATPGAGARQDVTLTVSAASDLTPAFGELGPAFTDATGIGIEFNFGSTGQLAQQIIAGAPVDVFAAANVAFINQLDDQRLIIADTQALYARGRITLWTRSDSGLRITDLSQVTDPAIDRIAIANPDHAPYGVAAREAMQSAGLWDAFQDKLVLGENVSDTLRLAQTGNVDIAIVALSLSLASDGRWTLIDETLHEPIDQAVAVIAATDHEPEARAFVEFVNGEQGREVMRRYGFVLPGEAIVSGTPPLATPDATPGS
ncbi:MAG TPA: molybdate ABC transporter substrate-binding protein [Thermomicrobiales bacterium]|nr:molybdate ABC transporter substrate-binding protein [Thermomicrobiales bacterium]